MYLFEIFHIIWSPEVWKFMMNFDVENNCVKSIVLQSLRSMINSTVSFCIDLENCICWIYGTFCFCQNIVSTLFILHICKASGYEAYLDIFGGIYLSANWKKISGHRWSSQLLLKLKFPEWYLPKKLLYLYFSFEIRCC